MIKPSRRFIGFLRWRNPKKNVKNFQKKPQKIAKNTAKTCCIETMKTMAWQLKTFH